MNAVDVQPVMIHAFKLYCKFAPVMFNACALLEFTEAPTHTLRVLYSVDIGITNTTSPTLDIAALCLSLWPAAKLSDAYMAEHISQMQSEQLRAMS